MEEDVAMQEQDEKRQADDEDMVVDEEERLERMRLLEQQRREVERKKMTSVVRQNLPRPTVINTQMFEDTETSSEPDQAVTHAQKLVKDEMLVLMVHDNKTYPLKGMKSSKLPKNVSEKKEYSLDMMERARELIED